MSATAAAQVAVGDIAVTRFSTTTFAVIGAGSAVTSYVTPGFLGTGTSQAVLWDRANPNDFIVGGVGFVGRASITGPAAVSYSLITNGVGTAAQMSWNDAGWIVVADSGTSQVRLLDPASGFVVDLSTGAQPWGTSLSAGAWDPITGDVVVGGDGALYRLANGSSTGTLIVGGLGGFVSAVAFDPTTGEIVATVLTVNRLIRVDSLGTVTNIAPPFSIPGPNGLDVDQNGDYVAGGGTGQVYRVSHAGGSPVLLANNPGPLNGIAVAGGGGFGIPFGQTCNGAAGPVSLTATGPFVVGSTVTTTSTNHEAFALGVLILGISNTNYLGIPLPLLLDPLFGTAGCHANVSLDVTAAALTSGTSPATLVFAFALPPSFSGHRFYAQHICFENVAGGWSWSNGLAFRVP
ncbi:MAG TPA: hypothetical protein VFT55_01080 [Planctomycetota bacterium]|nr:hypothetical protein [Planctomycetota bacterium]